MTMPSSASYYQEVVWVVETTVDELRCITRKEDAKFEAAFAKLAYEILLTTKSQRWENSVWVSYDP